VSQRKQTRGPQSRLSTFYVVAGVILAVVVVAVIALRQQNAVSSTSPIEFPHIHGLGYSADGNRLYAPAHIGLAVYENNQWNLPTDLPAHDYMGYSAMDTGFYSSGDPDLRTDFPSMLGVIKSEDEGRSVETLAFTGESDFHLMSVGYFSHAIYLFNTQPNSGIGTGLYYTTDEGQTWTQSRAQGLSAHPLQIAVHPTEQGTIAIATQAGLFLSQDSGSTFTPIASNAPVTAATFDLSENVLLFGYQNLGRYELSTGAIETVQSPTVSAQDAITYLTTNPSTGELALATANKNIYIWSNNRQEWQQIANEGVG